MDYPYTKSARSIPRLFQEIRKVGTPSKVTVTYLKSIGFTSSNDTYLVGLLKGIGFLDSAGNPTDRWSRYRGPDHKAVMAEAVHHGYANLFATYPDAQIRDDEAIANKVRHDTSYGADTVGRVVASFKALCSLADFGTPDPQAPAAGPLGVPAGVGVSVNSGQGNGDVGQNGWPKQPIINLNIQLELPAQADEQFYDAFFAAMKKHLMP